MATTASRSPDSLTQARAFQEALLELVALVRSLDREVASASGLSLAQSQALRLWSEGGSLTVNDLAGRLRVDKSTASRIAAGLEGKGCLTRTRDDDDGRVVWLSATPAGHRLRMRIDGEQVSRIAQVLGDFDPEVGTAMTRLLARLVASFSARADAAGDGARRAE